VGVVDENARRIGTGIALLALVVLVYSCEPNPPVRMSWESTDSFTVETVSSDYDVSRFWACGWAGGCPMKQWKRCLEVTPEEPLAALLWYSRTSKAHVDLMREIMDESAPVNWPVNAPGRLESRIAYARQNGQAHDWETKLLLDMQKIQRKDRAVIDDILSKTREGVFFTATYQIVGDNRRSKEWSIYPGCDGRPAIPAGH
jgi:hypothetical protein